MRNLNKFIFIIFLFGYGQSLAATTPVDCTSSSTVQAALGSANDGDTVQCNATGTYSWGTLDLPSNKNFTLDGNGSTITSGTINIYSTASFYPRITNFIFRSDGIIDTKTPGITNNPWRIDHCTFNAAGTSSNAMVQTHYEPGLIDNCDFINIPTAKETIHNMGWNPGVTTGWTNDHTPGSPNALYIEDCTASGSQGNSSNLIQNYYGARVVVRFNTLNAAMVDAHGNHTAYSARWWEIYGNALSGSTYLCMRGGSGLIFNNTGSGTALFINETANNLYGIGDGKNTALYPAYIWDNGSLSYAYNVDGCSVHLGTVDVGTDISTPDSGTTLPGSCDENDSYWITNEGGNWNTTNASANDGMLYKCTSTDNWTEYYTPYIYPHPLREAVVVVVPANAIQGVTIN